jgi:hypothetical protein
VVDWTIHCHARSGPLMAGGGRPLAPGRDIAAQCFRAPGWRCRRISVLFVLVIPVGVATAASAMSDLNPGGFWPDKDASDIVFAAPVSAAGAEPTAVSLLAGGKTS